MKRVCPCSQAFSLIELILVIVVIAFLAGLLIPSVAISKTKAQRVLCLNNLTQIHLGIRLYAEDHNDVLPDNGVATYQTYRELINKYTGQTTASSPQDRLFTCPRDTFSFDETTGNFSSEPHHNQLAYDYSSYAFNGLNGITNFPGAQFGVVLAGIRGQRLASVKNPTKTVVVVESSALFPYSWHEPAPGNPASTPTFKDAKSIVSFADGHAAFIKIYWDSALVYPSGLRSLAAYYDPPEGYEYKWSGD